MTGEMLTYRLNAEGVLRVTDWGEPSRHMIVPVNRLDPWNGSWKIVEYWDILWVNAYVRHFPADRRLDIQLDVAIQESGWTHWALYSVKSWCYIRDVFDEYFGTAGLYHRVSFQVETWTWSRSGTWEIDDQV